MRRADKLRVPMVLKSGSLSHLEPSGPVQACNWIALPFNCTVCVCVCACVRACARVTSVLSFTRSHFIFFYRPYLFLLNILCSLHVLFPFPLSLRQVKRRCDAENRRHSTEATQAYRHDRKIQTHGHHQNFSERGHSHNFAYVV